MKPFGKKIFYVLQYSSVKKTIDGSKKGIEKHKDRLIPQTTPDNGLMFILVGLILIMLMMCTVVPVDK